MAKMVNLGDLDPLTYVSAVKYLGIYVVAAKCFKLSIDHLKVKFYRVFNCIYHKVKAPNSELVIVQLLKSYCLPFSCMPRKLCHRHTVLYIH